ncbi:hypothetical protein L210DRAFT_673852 [Boletus edulis BED1]|uniref:Uncharacterized protein n=1 Tax=Boletus edulis BED1 TaxID=1328754 RepID=A0AAD4BZ89_BOLED|nr:hypothetical protein L210DRAFT_673852 [Boletus edulis BED1]
MREFCCTTDLVQDKYQTLTACTQYLFETIIARGSTTHAFQRSDPIYFVSHPEGLGSVQQGFLHGLRSRYRVIGRVSYRALVFLNIMGNSPEWPDGNRDLHPWARSSTKICVCWLLFQCAGHTKEDRSSIIPTSVLPYCHTHRTPLTLPLFADIISV